MYKQEITGKHRTAFIFAVDRSLSMSERVVCEWGHTLTKADMVAQAVNDMLSELEKRALREGCVRNYFDIAVLGYWDGKVVPLIDPKRPFIPISELRNYEPRRYDRVVEHCDRNGCRVVTEESADAWIDPVASGSTPMYEAFWEIGRLVSGWCANPLNAGSFPPVVINITDGEASDCDPVELRNESLNIRRQGTADGNVLLMNVHITTSTCGGSLLFPTDDEVGHENLYSRLLADCSSVMPSVFNGIVRDMRRDEAEPPYLAMGYNTSPKDLFAMLNIGSRSVTGIR